MFWVLPSDQRIISWPLHCQCHKELRGKDISTYWAKAKPNTVKKGVMVGKKQEKKAEEKGEDKAEDGDKKVASW